MTDLEALQLKYDELEVKYNKKCDYNWEITCKFLSLKNRIGLYIINPLNILLNRNNKLKPEYKLDLLNEKLIREILDEIENYQIMSDEKI